MEEELQWAGGEKRFQDSKKCIDLMLSLDNNLCPIHTHTPGLLSTPSS
jgi:hypothetical protein